MSYFDFAGATKVVQMVDSANYPPATYSPSLSPGAGDTLAVDVRDYLGALIIVNVGTASADSECTLRVQSASEPSFSSWSNLTKVGGGDAVFDAINSGNDNTFYFARIDLSKAQNALGVELEVTSGGSSRTQISVTAVLFPRDTSNASEPQFKV
jgi:hypothetical protein